MSVLLSQRATDGTGSDKKKRNALLKPKATFGEKHPVLDINMYIHLIARYQGMLEKIRSANQNQGRML